MNFYEWLYTGIFGRMKVWQNASCMKLLAQLYDMKENASIILSKYLFFKNTKGDLEDRLSQEGSSFFLMAKTS